MIIPKTRSARVGPMDAGFLAPLITDFEAALTGLGHTSLTIKGYTDSARHFAAWACEAGLHLDDLSQATVNRFAGHDCQCAGTRRWHGVSRKYARRAGRFVGFLAERGVVPPALRPAVEHAHHDVHRDDRGDYVDRNGHTWGYEVYTLENGDKIYAEYTATVQTVVGADGSKKTSFEGTTRWTGGIGKYQGVRGIQWDHGTFDPDKGFNQEKSEAEYWFEK
jgi:hypothetical protein